MTRPCVTCVKPPIPSQSPFFQKCKKDSNCFAMVFIHQFAPQYFFNPHIAPRTMIFHHVHFVYDHFLELQLQKLCNTRFWWTLDNLSLSHPFLYPTWQPEWIWRVARNTGSPTVTDRPHVWSLEIAPGIWWCICSKSVRAERPRVHRLSNDS